ncbi:hypothetical protein F53441_11728 [Fusarium austroafricanum]|uniref:Nucleotide-diphospho-sugar transferase domain-containing protein n=1 Tax=Fusarium austroafricanum TaxID=2364996 RepID=A0A8H4NYP7_9HYPO|nr:hypothetical protein F53441_11728 [Fusarium austroafricanum]
MGVPNFQQLAMLLVPRASRQKGVLMAMSILVIFGLVTHSWGFYFSPTILLTSRYVGASRDASSSPFLTRRSPSTTFSNPAQVKLADHTSDLMHDLWKPFILDINATRFLTNEGYKYEIPKDREGWTKPLGKKLLILDVDTRMDTGPGALMNETTLNYKEMKGRSGGLLNHYLYAMIHGYDYKFLRAPNYPKRHGTWVKVPAIKEALKTHDIVVFLDADAEFMYPQIPFEWLMRLWNVTDKTLIALANDPDSPKNRDEKGKVMQNTGFMIAQQSNKTQEMFKDWDECPTEKKFKGCQRWANDWAHEQAAFSNYIRYSYNETEINHIPCMDGNGAPYIGDKTCGGVFIRHHWFRKDDPAKDLQHLILNAFVGRLHAGFHNQVKDNFVDASRHTYPLDHLII